MSLTATDPGGGDFTPAPAGTHIARCYRVIDSGTQYSERWGKKAHKCLVSWELPGELMTEGDKAGEPFTVHKRYTVSLHEKAELRKNLEAWRGRAFSDDELKGFNLRNILDKPCMISVTYNTVNGKTYDNVSAVMAMPKGQQCPDLINPQVWFDLDAFDQTVFDSLSDNMKNTIMASEEYKARHAHHEQGGGAENDFDDDIPF